MDSSHLDRQAEKGSPETPSDSSMSSDSHDTSDMFEDPVLHPRVGDDYQAEVPPMLSESELLQLKINPADCEGVFYASRCFLMENPIPVTWVHNRTTSINNESSESENIAKSHTSLINGYCAVPHLPIEALSDFEVDSFLLGLYIFGKNLLQVKIFMGIEKIGKILFYYYGQFRGSAAYCKWSECRKMRNRKCIIGDRFFTGYRQQELLSRLLSRLSEESKTKLLEASRAFAEGSTSLDEYVSTLKALVGIHALVEAVAIGKGKEDLTTLVVDSKIPHTLTHRPEVPSAKAYSSLTLPEIVEYLKGGFRLSKARSIDLFWEAIWPRLLARGWHSEQPRVDVYAGSKNGLVFLMPGITKFSRRNLTKGDDYFDSVTDVLAKVACEPKLLELESDETNPESSKEENGWALEVNSDDGPDLSDHEHHCYLKPRISAGRSNHTKFTVVDTSLADEENPLKTRELRSLPLDAEISSNPSNRSTKNGTRFPGNTNILPNSLQSSNVCLSNDFKSRAIKRQNSGHIKPGLSSCSEPNTKRRKRGSSGKADATFVLGLPARKKIAAVKLKIPSSDGKILGDKMNEKIVNFLPENRRIPEPEKVIDLNLPQIRPENGGNAKVVTSEEVKNNTNQLSDTKDFKDARVSSAGMERTNKDGGGKDQRQPRRQSTRNRPLTTKALEALEIGLLNPVKNSRKRSSSTTQDQKHSKRSYQPRNNESFVFSDIAGFQERAYNTEIDTFPKPSVGNIRTELSGLSKASCPPEAAA